jgi:hypothetical protein
VDTTSNIKDLDKAVDDDGLKISKLVNEKLHEHIRKLNDKVTRLRSGHTEGLME